jgi:hypothetical protein
MLLQIFVISIAAAFLEDIAGALEEILDSV